jgi:CheY-like chemotaxis protein
MSSLHPGATASRRVDILMIEDDIEYRRLVERWLASSTEPRFGVKFASRLDEAWHRIGISDLIVLDLGLPDAAGMETLVAARELAGDLPIVVLTANDDDDIGRRALRAGADAFVPKRCAEAQTLHVALRRALAARSPSTPQARLRRAVPDRSASFDDRGALLAGLAHAQEESWVEDFWIDARYGSITVRAR